MKSVLVFFLLAIVSVFGKQGFGPTDQEWGYVEVRQNANMFWWLHYTTADSDPTKRPLVIWLQGGPGGSSTGYGNFMEIGPLTVHQEARNTSWVNNVNLLLVDNPVGTGFSYVNDVSALTTNNSQIATDFLQLMKAFYKELPEFENVPLYIFSESYGGKMAAEIALVLYEENQRGNINCKISGVGLGDSWISPFDSVLHWGPYLQNLGAVDRTGYSKIVHAAMEVSNALRKEDGTSATDHFFETESVILKYTSNIDFYNVLTKIPSSPSDATKSFSKTGLIAPIRESDDQLLADLMNGPVKSALNLSSDWDSNSVIKVLNNLYEDFMLPVKDVVERLLDETDIEVVVYNGQLDLIVNTPGVVAWLGDLKWRGAGEWKTADSSAFSVDGFNEGYYKNVDNLHLYLVNRAGHMVPIDNPGAMEYILRQATKNYTV